MDIKLIILILILDIINGLQVEFFSATYPEEAIIMIDYVEFTPSKFNVLMSSIDNLIQTAMSFVENSEDYASVLKPDLEIVEDDAKNK